MNTAQRGSLISIFISLWCACAFASTKLLNTRATAVTGIAVDSTTGTVYYIESSGSLNRIVLTPTCSLAKSCAVERVAGGFSHPEDLVLDSAHGAAYVTVSDVPGTTAHCGAWT